MASTGWPFRTKYKCAFEIVNNKQISDFRIMPKFSLEKVCRNSVDFWVGAESADGCMKWG